jgi:saccharopine dehydrogenase (NAD+, L-lysine-forming)
MNSPAAIRSEDKNRFEARAPLTPEDMAQVIEQTAAEFIIQPSPIRIFKDDEYRACWAEIGDDISSCPLVFAVKEIPEDCFLPGRTYVFFSHTTKGQPYNMLMLKKLKELRCNLIDYEKIADDQNRRLIFFGRYAGIAGLIDTLWALGRRFEAEKVDNPFTALRRTYQYDGLEAAVAQMKEVARIIERDGLDRSIAPLVAGFTGYGNVSMGAQEIYDLLPVEEVTPDQLAGLSRSGIDRRHSVYKVVFREEDMFEPIEDDVKFELQDYYDNPGRYRSVFRNYLPHLSILINCIYWDPRYPRFLTRESARRLYLSPNGGPRLKVIGDISVDIEGSIELTVKSTEPDNPVFLYDVGKDRPVDGFTGNGPLIMAVDNLPCELPRESSREFSAALRELTPVIINADFDKSFDECGLSPELKRGTILYKGEFTPDFRYMEEFVS